MDKSLIKKYLDSTFLMEESKPKGLGETEKVQKDSEKINKDAMKHVEKEMNDYSKMDGEKENAEAVKKYENSDDAKEYHDEIEILNGQEMIDYDNEPSEEFKERAKEGMGANGGSSRMGNKTGEDTANAEPAFEASSEEFGDELEKRVENSKKKRKEAEAGQEARLGVSTKSDTNDSKLNEGMKRLVFKKEFNGVENALKMIPESYKVDNKTFQMTDGNENYEIRWEGSLNEGRAIVLKASDKQLMNEDMQKMKHLMGYKSQETLGNLKGAERIDENKTFNNIWNKTKDLLNESEEDKTEK